MVEGDRIPTLGVGRSRVTEMMVKGYRIPTLGVGWLRVTEYLQRESDG